MQKSNEVMARFNSELPYDLIKQFADLETSSEKMMNEMVTAGAKVVEKNIRHNINGKFKDPSKILEYFSGEKDQVGDAGLILMLKGAYSYYITYYLIRYRTYIQYNLGFYNQILIISLIISACYLISPFNYWLPRTAFLLEFPVLLYWAKSLQYVPNWYWLRNVSLFLTGFFTFRTLLLIFVF